MELIVLEPVPFKLQVRRTMRTNPVVIDEIDFSACLQRARALVRNLCQRIIRNHLGLTLPIYETDVVGEAKDTWSR